MNKNLSPIVLFTYNRPEHTKKTVEALQKNELASQSELFIYSDGGNDEKSWNEVSEVRNYLKTIKGFKNITLTFQKKNIGLADSIISGVTNIVNKYGKIIVLEDDIVTSPFFLKFMNEALNFYENEKKVWHISGWNYPIQKEDSDETFLWRGMDCWGWATWKDRWKYFEKNTTKLINSFDDYDIYKFNFDGTHNVWLQVLYNQLEKINSWAVFWYAVIFKNNGLCLNPANTFVDNIGFGENSTHCKTKKNYIDNIVTKYNIKFETNIFESIKYLEIIKQYLFIQNINTDDKNLNFSKKFNSFYKQILQLDGKIIVYGNGTVGKTIQALIPSKIIGYVDIADENNHPLNLKNMLYDKVLISVLGREERITRYLANELKIDINKIITIDL